MTGSLVRIKKRVLTKVFILFSCLSKIKYYICSMENIKRNNLKVYVGSKLQKQVEKIKPSNLKIYN